MPKRNLAARAGHWSARHRKTAILGWLAFVVIAFVLGGAIGTQSLSDEDSGNGESRAADHAILKADFPDEADEQVLVQARTPGLTVADPKFQAGVEDALQRLSVAKHTAKIESPLAAGNEGQISEDRGSALITFTVPGDEEQGEDQVVPSLNATAAAQKAHPDLRIEQFGDASAGRALDASFEEDFQRAEFLSLPITLLILIVAFGSLVAAGVPLLLAITAVFATLGLLAPISQLVPMEDAAASVVLLIGLAVGVDYSMFYMRRKMEERDAGRSSEAALEIAAATSGRAVLVSGFTVMIAMAGMFISGNAVFTSMALGTILVVAVAMIGSVTVLPAVLSKLGDNIERGRVPLIGRMRHRNHGESRVWGWVIDRSLAHPVIATVGATGVLLALAIPALNMHTVNPGAAGLPHDLPVVQTYERIQEKFPGGPIPALVVVEADDVTAPAVTKGIEALTATARGPVSTTVSPDKTVAIVALPLAGNGTDERSDAALMTLRDRTIPATIGSVAGTETNVTGLTAGSKDFNDRMVSRLPFVFAFVLGLAFLLLLVTFRSVIVPLKAIVLNLLSVGAAYGILVWVFQYGNLEGLLDFRSVDGITSWLPLFLFVVLFGLSMDYHVFIISRIREAVDRGERTDDAVAHGIKATAGVVTSAAIVMVGVFSVFATLSAIEFKMMGVGLAVAILLDATLVRAVLLPAAMKLLGEWNWYLPRQLSWLPKFDHDTAPGGAHA